MDDNEEIMEGGDEIMEGGDEIMEGGEEIMEGGDEIMEGGEIIEDNMEINEDDRRKPKIKEVDNDVIGDSKIILRGGKKQFQTKSIMKKGTRAIENIEFMKDQIIDMYPFFDNSHFTEISSDKIPPTKNEEIDEDRMMIQAKKKDSDTQNEIEYGALYDGDNFYIGEYKDGMPNGLIRKFDAGKIIEFEGQMHNSFKFDDGIAEKYFDSGDKYIGEIKDEQMNGEGEYYFNDGNRYLGEFKDDKRHGKGKLLKAFGLSLFDVEYNLNELISCNKCKVQDKFYLPGDNKFKFLNEAELGTLFSFFNQLTPTLSKKELKFGIVNNINGTGINQYIGQYDPDTKNKEGRGILCKIGKNFDHYYVGHFKNDLKEGFGYYFDNSKNEMRIEYEGEYKNDLYDGIGHLSINGQSYYGQFSKGKRHGFGEQIPEKLEDRYMVEGIFKNDQSLKNVTIDLITNNMNELNYSKTGNLISTGNDVEMNSLDYKREVGRSKLKLKMKVGLGKTSNEIDELEPLKGVNFKFGKKYLKEGLYVGELNNFNQRSGRGKLTNLRDKSYYLGYWVSNQKNFFGGIYDKNNNPLYVGEYHLGKPYGQGIYKIYNKYNNFEPEYVFGYFDSIGNGEEITFVNPETHEMSKENGRNFYAGEEWKKDVLEFLDKITKSNNIHESNDQKLEDVFLSFRKGIYKDLIFKNNENIEEIQAGENEENEEQQ